MIQGNYIIRLNENIAKDIYKMVLEGDTSVIKAPGQFVNIKLQGNYLRRPISIADWDSHSFTLLYKVVGKGTSQMAGMQKGESLNIIAGLGNGFTVNDCKNALLVGGGIGLAPLYGLTKYLKQDKNRNVTVVAGAATKDDIFYIDEFKALGAKVLIATDNGSAGTKGFVTDAINAADVDFDYFFTCGPTPMTKAVINLVKEKNPEMEGQLSLEERMGCGFGACVGCSIQTKNGVRRVCKDGPVFTNKELEY